MRSFNIHLKGIQRGAKEDKGKRILKGIVVNNFPVLKNCASL